MDFGVRRPQSPLSDSAERDEKAATAVAALQKEIADARAKVVFGYPWWLRPFLLQGVVAITLGRRIYVRKEIDERLLRHELAHVRQVNRHGLFGFVVRYAYEFLRNLLRERSVDRAYRAISFEREAFEAEAYNPVKRT